MSNAIMRRPYWVLALAGLLLACPLWATAAAAKDLPLSYQDRVAIKELLYRYCYYIDNRIGDAWASTFTPDGKLEFPGTTVQGHDQLVAFGSRPVVDKLRNHFVGDILLVQTAPGRVHERSMVITSLRDPKGDAPATFEGIGVYDDQIIKTPAGWRFLSRRAGWTMPVSPDFLPQPSQELETSRHR
ncbi:MAG TPA: nuclear transport factor 2 family protein [Alphaproteobacteria bacterium]|nr:nuclear transport factor 2 family protein [Alphaproteobacteria bacterium]